MKRLTEDEERSKSSSRFFEIAFHAAPFCCCHGREKGKGEKKIERKRKKLETKKNAWTAPRFSAADFPTIAQNNFLGGKEKEKLQETGKKIT
jgi:hypothetical protein